MKNKYNLMGFQVESSTKPTLISSQELNEKIIKNSKIYEGCILEILNKLLERYSPKNLITEKTCIRIKKKIFLDELILYNTIINPGCLSNISIAYIDCILEHNCKDWHWNRIFIPNTTIKHAKWVYYFSTNKDTLNLYIQSDIKSKFSKNKKFSFKHGSLVLE